MNFNSPFTSNIQDLYGEKGISWINNLPSQIALLSTKWNIRFLGVLPNLTYNFVGLVELSTGDKAILKIAPISKSIAAESAWLRCFTKGVPNVYWYDEEHYALLMERLQPGNSLKTLVNDDAATRIICETIRELQTHQQGHAHFEHLSELAGNFSILEGHLDQKILSRAESLFRDLTADRTHDVILHGDLHHDNILSSAEVWKAIDPHGYIGDPAYEVGAMIYNSFPSDASIPKTVERRLKILSEELPFDAHKIRAWAFCKTVLSIAWTFEDHKKIPAFELQIASAIFR